MMHSSGKKGFTLAEIMMVVVVIALLAAMAVPAYQRISANSREQAIINNLRQFAAAGQQYMLEFAVTEASYEDIVDPEGNYIRVLHPIMSEDYTTLMITNTSTEIEIDIPGDRVLTFTF